MLLNRERRRTINLPIFGRRRPDLEMLFRWIASLTGAGGVDGGDEDRGIRVHRPHFYRRPPLRLPTAVVHLMPASFSAVTLRPVHPPVLHPRCSFFFCHLKSPGDLGHRRACQRSKPVCQSDGPAISAPAARRRSAASACRPPRGGDEEDQSGGQRWWFFLQGLRSRYRHHVWRATLDRMAWEGVVCERLPGDRQSNTWFCPWN